MKESKLEQLHKMLFTVKCFKGKPVIGPTIIEKAISFYDKCEVLTRSHSLRTVLKTASKNSGQYRYSLTIWNI